MTTKDRNDQARRARAFAVLGEAYNRKMSETGLAAYELGLHDVDPEVVERAIAIAIRTAKWMPSPAELRDLCGAGERSLEERAIAAWAAVDRAADVVGSYRAVTFSDPAVNAAIRSMGGWPALLSRTTPDFNTHARREFIKAYIALKHGGVGEEQGAGLAGLGTAADVRQADGTTKRIEAQPAVVFDVDRMRVTQGPRKLVFEANDNEPAAEIPRVEFKRP